MLGILFVFLQYFWAGAIPPHKALGSIVSNTKTKQQEAGMVANARNPSALWRKAEIQGQPHLCSKLVLQESLSQTTKEVRGMAGQVKGTSWQGAHVESGLLFGSQAPSNGHSRDRTHVIRLGGKHFYP